MDISYDMEGGRTSFPVQGNSSSGNGVLTEDRERMIHDHVPMVKYIAQRLAVKLPSHVILDDLISAGIVGLLDAVEKYDSERNVKFGTYAQFRIRGAMLDSLREMDWIPRSVRSRADEIGSLYERLEKNLGRPATEEEVAVEMGVGVDEFMGMLDSLNSASIISIEDFFAGEDMSLLDAVADPEAKDPQGILADKETKLYLGRAVDGLPEKERLVATLYYYEELTMKEIGNVLGLTESRVCQLHTQAMLRLKGKIKKRD